MALAVTTKNSMVIRFEKGSYTFNKFTPSATDDQLYNLSVILNSMQVDAAERVLRVKTIQII
jgi:hypothetical protein